MTELTTAQTVNQSVRKFSLGLGDRLKVVSAKTSRTSNKDVDVALVKATSSRFPVVPKEKHVVTLKMAASTYNANHLATVLLKRLKSATDWLTALKTLIVVHRLVRETDGAAFMQEIVRVGGFDNKGRGARVLDMENFLDTTNIDGRFDYSEWVRAYAKYLDESLETFTAIGWNVDLETPGSDSRLRSLSATDLLQQLPHLQRLQRRLVDCLPKGQAARDPVVLYSLSLMVRESFRLYKALSEGLINLLDNFFQMDYVDAVKGLDSYREAVSSAEALAGFYSAVRAIDAVESSIELPQLEPPPSDLIESMESYVKEAPRPEGAVAVDARKSVPLRRGRMSQQAGHQSSLAPSTEDASVQRDPGMLLSPSAGPDAVASSSIVSPPLSPREVGNEEVAGEASCDDADTNPRPEVDLLGFLEAELVRNSEEPNSEEGPGVVGPFSQPSAMDLLGELDFGALSMGSNQQPPGPMALQSQSTSWTGASAIPDAFVVRAAADVYGRPTPQSAIPSPQAAAVYGQYRQIPSPHGQPTIALSQLQGGVGLKGSGQHVNFPVAGPGYGAQGLQGYAQTYGTTAYQPYLAPSPTTAWTTTASTSPAGLEDPFIGLTGIPGSQGTAGPGLGLR